MMNYNNYNYLPIYLSRTNKTVIVDVVIVSSAMWVERWERGERGED
jgi:hypothetical protein